MSELAKLTAAPLTDVLPGYTLSPPTLADFGQQEAELERRHIATAGAAAVGLPASVAEAIIKAATNDVASGKFKFGRAAFDAHTLAPTSLPFLLYLTLRRNHADLTREKTASLVKTENEAKLNRAVLKLFGYPVDGEPADPKNGAGATPTGTGETSSPSSEPANAAP